MRIDCVLMRHRLRQFIGVRPIQIPTDLLPNDMTNDIIPSRMGDPRHIIKFILKNNIFCVGILLPDLFLGDSVLDHLSDTLKLTHQRGRFFTKGRIVDAFTLVDVEALQEKELKPEEEDVVNE